MFKKNYVVGLLLVVVTISFWIKYYLFSDNLLLVDQAHYAYWLKSLHDSDHFFPLNGVSGIYGDTTSFIHQLGIRIYNDPFRAFNVVSMAFFYLFSLLINFTPLSFNTISILSNSLIIIPLTLLVLTYAEKMGDKNIASLKRSSLYILIILFLTTPYVNYFSFIGVHNTGHIHHFFYTDTKSKVTKFLRV